MPSSSVSLVHSTWYAMSPLSGRSEGSKKTATPPQDSCWSIPAVAMCASFLLCMTQSSTGYLYVLFMEKFQVNREMASWPESIIMLTQNLGGFVVTVLHSRLPIFYVTLLSASLCSAGLVGAAFAPDMKWMSVMLGGIYGFFRDTLGSYDNFYRMLGAVNICIAALLFVLVWRDKMRRKSCDLPRAAMGR